jgi:N-acyl-phosphatidylethanolamine-hydrolysing phospholipase D
MGPKRFRPIPICVHRIPRVDVVIISHNHYDHLDHQSVIDLNQKFAHRGLKWFVGAGTARWFNSCGIYCNVFEFNWWQWVNYRGLRFIFTPSQHWCARGLTDVNKVKSLRAFLFYCTE